MSSMAHSGRLKIVKTTISLTFTYCTLSKNLPLLSNSSLFLSLHKHINILIHIIFVLASSNRGEARNSLAMYHEALIQKRKVSERGYNTL